MQYYGLSNYTEEQCNIVLFDYLKFYDVKNCFIFCLLLFCFFRTFSFARQRT